MRLKLSRFFRVKSGKRKLILFILLITPAFLLRLVTAAYPILQTAFISLTNLNLLANTNEFIGLGNYPVIFDTVSIQRSISFTVALVVSSTALGLIAGMLVALLLNEQFRGTRFARTINLIPWAIPTIVAGYALRWLLSDQFGLIPYWVNQITGYRMVVFISPLASQIAVILAHVWKDAPFLAFIFLAGLQGVPVDLYDAAKVDGAGAWRRFWYITFPLILPLTITMGLFRLVWTLGSFDLVFGLTQGGPGVATSVLALQIFREGIMFFKFGFASAISVVLLILVGIIGVLGLWLFRKADVSY
ncbi:MAG TPA: sugar ABC transporter permease [Levilinea sp.]|nr:sugar ABC transporter permease [Levilinea sp.]